MMGQLNTHINSGCENLPSHRGVLDNSMTFIDFESNNGEVETVSWIKVQLCTVFLVRAIALKMYGVKSLLWIFL